MFRGYDEVEQVVLPELSRCAILVEGQSKSGKTALIGGNPDLIIMKCYDGHAVIPRCRAKVVRCPNLETFLKLNTALMRAAEKAGDNSPYCQICFDPISVVVGWFAQAAVASHNKKKFEDSDGNVSEAFKHKLIETPGEIGGYGPWNDIAYKIEALFRRWGELGWGWIAPIHYQWKAASDFGGGMDWKPNIPATTADRLSKIADVAVTTVKTGEEFGLVYTSEVTQNLGSRVPIVGECDLPTYYEGESQGIASWDYLKADYDKACRLFQKDQRAFEKTWAEICEKADAMD